MQCDLILLTHGHFDHIMALKEIKEATGASICIHEADAHMLTEEYMHTWKAAAAHGYHQALADRLLKDGDQIQLGTLTIRVMHTPGHTQGSVCYYFPEEKVLISGDTLFAQSVGRTDFPTSDVHKMRESIRRLLETLPADTDVYPGHMGETTIGYEKRYNPFA